MINTIKNVSFESRKSTPTGWIMAVTCAFFVALLWAQIPNPIIPNHLRKHIKIQGGKSEKLSNWIEKCARFLIESTEFLVNVT